MIYNYENTTAIGKPARVYVNGNLVDYALVADTGRGVVIYAPSPMRVNKKTEEIYTRKLRGKVEVVYI